MIINRHELNQIAHEKHSSLKGSRYAISYSEAYRETLDAIFVQYAFPGGYTIEFTTSCDILCADCAREAFLSRQFDTAEGMHSGILWEGPSHYCAKCNKEIDSAYGLDTDE